MLGGPIIGDPDRPDYGSLCVAIMGPCTFIFAIGGSGIGMIVNGNSGPVVGMAIGGLVGIIIPLIGLGIAIIRLIRRDQKRTTRSTF